MSFNSALSGLRAASLDLSVTGNNISNASTIGFKTSRAEFGDIYASSVLGVSTNAAGSGVQVTDIAQQFEQGNISFTDNNLDLAINGSGFFVLSDNGAPSYTRAGIFGLDNQGYIVANNGSRLQGFPASESGVVSAGVLSDLQIQNGDIEPKLTSQVDMTFNVDSRAKVPATTTFDSNEETSFNFSTSMTIYDSLGNSHIMTSYFQKQAPVAPATSSNNWKLYIKIDGKQVGGVVATPAEAAFNLVFNSDGSLNAASSDKIFIDNWTPSGNGVTTPFGPGNGASPVVADPPSTSNFNVSITGSTQFGSDFSVSSIKQDGFAPGRLTGVEVDEGGFLFARYTNGQAKVLGQVALASFANEQGLSPQGSSGWTESFESGVPVVGAPTTGSLGVIQSGALEESNVDISTELVNLIIAQRNFQGNAKTIETNDTVTQAILNLR